MERKMLLPGDFGGVRIVGTDKELKSPAEIILALRKAGFDTRQFSKRARRLQRGVRGFAVEMRRDELRLSCEETIALAMTGEASRLGKNVSVFKLVHTIEGVCKE